MADNGGVEGGDERELTLEELADRWATMAPAEPAPEPAPAAEPVAQPAEPPAEPAEPLAEPAEPLVGDILAGGAFAHREVRRRRWPKVLAGTIAALVVVGGAAAAYKVATAEPDEWDKDILPLATFVENNRGGRFEHPVPITFDEPKEYEKAFAIDDDSVDPKELEDAVGELRALGLVSGDLDLIGTSETLGSEGTVGFYSPEDQKIHVKGTRPDLQKVEVRSTLVHELTHAYDDQHFDLDLEDDVSGGEEFGHRAVVEGSARVIEGKYVESLSEADLAKYEAAFDEDTGSLKGADEALKDVPPVFLEVFGMPYELGPRFLDSLRVSRGEKGVGGALDQALRTWPRTESQIVHPDRYPAEGKARQVPKPKLKPGEVRIKQDVSEADFGEVSLAIVLAPHVGAEEALAAVSDWTDDAVVRYRAKKGGPACIRVAVAVQGVASADRFQRAAQRWAEAIPGASVIPLDADGFEGAVLDACDPGADGPAVKTAAPTVTETLGVRADLVSVFLAEGLPKQAAECLADRGIAKLGTAHVLELNPKIESDPAALAEVQQAFGAAATECGLQPPG